MCVCVCVCLSSSRKTNEERRNLFAPFWVSVNPSGMQLTAAKSRQSPRGEDARRRQPDSGNEGEGWPEEVVWLLEATRRGCRVVPLRKKRNEATTVSSSDVASATGGCRDESEFNCACVPVTRRCTSEWPRSSAELPLKLLSHEPLYPREGVPEIHFLEEIITLKKKTFPSLLSNLRAQTEEIVTKSEPSRERLVREGIQRSEEGSPPDTHETYATGESSNLARV